MSATFLQLLKAQREILKTWEWYEEKEEGLGDRFKNEVAKKIELITAAPFIIHQRENIARRRLTTSLFS